MKYAMLIPYVISILNIDACASIKVIKVSRRFPQSIRMHMNEIMSIKDAIKLLYKNYYIKLLYKLLKTSM